MSKKNDPKSASEIQSQQWLEQLLLEEKKINSQQKSKTDAPPKAVLSTLHCCSHAGDLWKDASELRVLILHFQDQSSVSKPNGEDRCLPLHLAVKYHAPLKVIKLTQSLYPEAAKRKDDKGRLPLHYAALNHYQEAVSFLLSVYPEGAEVAEESEGSTPLQLAISASEGDEVNHSQRVTNELLRRVQKLADPEKTKIHYELETGLSLHAPWMRSRITVVGDGGVGKTSTIRHLFQEPFVPEHVSTCGISLQRTDLIYNDDDSGVSDGRNESFTKVDRNADGNEYARSIARSFSSSNDSLEKIVEEVLCRYSRLSSPSTSNEAALRNEERISITHAKDFTIEVGDLGQQIEVVLSAAKEKKNSGLSKNLTLSIWDYGGQRVFYGFHHLFLRREGVFLLIFNMGDFTSIKDPSIRREAVRQGAICPPHDRVAQDEKHCSVRYLHDDQTMKKCTNHCVQDTFYTTYRRICDICGCLCCTKNSCWDESTGKCTMCKDYDKDKSKCEAWEGEVVKALQRRQTNAEDALKFWLKSISIHAPGAPVLLIGTQKDIVNTIELQEYVGSSISKLLKEYDETLTIIKELPFKLPFIPLNNTQSGGHIKDAMIQHVIDQIRKSIFNDNDYIKRFKQLYIHRPIPRSWMFAIDELQKIKDKPYFYMEELKGHVEENGWPIDTKKTQGEEPEIERMVDEMDRLGLIIRFKKPEALRDIVIKDPQWLVDMFSMIIRDFSIHSFRRKAHSPVKHNGLMARFFGLSSPQTSGDVEKDTVLDHLILTPEGQELRNTGILAKAFLKQIPKWDKLDTKTNLMEKLVMLMDELGLMTKLDSDGDYYIVPSVLLQRNDSADDQLKLELKESMIKNGKHWVCKFKCTRSLPIGFFQHVIVSVLQKSYETNEAIRDNVRVGKSVVKLFVDLNTFWLVEADDKKSIMICVSDETSSTMKHIMEYLKGIVDEINSDFYNKKLDFEYFCCIKERKTVPYYKILSLPDGNEDVKVVKDVSKKDVKKMLDEGSDGCIIGMFKASSPEEEKKHSKQCRDWCKEFEEANRHRAEAEANRGAEKLEEVLEGVEGLKDFLKFMKDKQEQQMTLLMQQNENLNAKTIKHLESNLLPKINRGFESLRQMVVNMEHSDIPQFIVVLPGQDQEAGFFKKKVRSVKEVLGLKEYFMLYICDEGPFLLPDKIPQNEKPLHSGFQVSIPGETLKKLAPLFYFFSTLLQIVSVAGPIILPGIPIPRGIFRCENDTALFQESMKNLANVCDNDGTVREIDSMLNSLDDKEKANAFFKGDYFKSSYDALKEVLENHTKGEWQKFQSEGIMVKVLDNENNSFHWVGKQHLQTLRAANAEAKKQGQDKFNQGKDRFTFGQRTTNYGDNTSEKSGITSVHSSSYCGISTCCVSGICPFSR